MGNNELYLIIGAIILVGASMAANVLAPPGAHQAAVRADQATFNGGRLGNTLVSQNARKTKRHRQQRSKSSKRKKY